MKRTCICVAVSLLCWSHGTAAAQPAAPTSQISYHIEAVVADRAALEARFSPPQLRILKVLNRADGAQLPTLEVLVVPTSWHEDLLAYSTIPEAI